MLHEERTHWLKYWRLISQRSSRLPEWTRPCSQEWTPAYPVSHRSSQGRGRTPWEPAKMRDKLKSASTKTTFKVSIALTFIPHAARAGANGRDTYIIWVKFILILLKLLIFVSVHEIVCLLWYMYTTVTKAEKETTFVKCFFVYKTVREAGGYINSTRQHRSAYTPTNPKQIHSKHVPSKQHL